MKAGQFLIKGEQAEKYIAGFLKLNYSPVYLMNKNKMLIIVTEQYSFRNNSSFTLTFVIFKEEIEGENYLRIQIIGGGSGTGFFNFDFGKSKESIKGIYHDLKSYCQTQKYWISDLEMLPIADGFEYKE
ncbi:MAG: hypothetical protein CMO01_05195 [Thalassobius sp.]|nr:hypothetical protein [Thalassovita sp.]|tara:strand:+ start:53 stop:439 length:387 start_codon:yes stop_codon:yes gene_type:complete